MDVLELRLITTQGTWQAAAARGHESDARERIRPIPLCRRGHLCSSWSESSAQRDATGTPAPPQDPPGPPRPPGPRPIAGVAENCSQRMSLFYPPLMLVFSDGWELRDGRACRGAAPTFRWPARLACAAGRIPAARRPHSARLPRQHSAHAQRDEAAASGGCLSLHVRTSYAYQPPACRTYQRRRAACPEAPSTVHTPYTYQPRQCRTYHVPWHPR